MQPTCSRSRRTCATYECDGLTGWRAQPACVVLPGSADEVQAVAAPLRPRARPVRRARPRHRSLGRRAAGGGGVVISLARMNRILEIDLASRARRRRAGRDESRGHTRRRGRRVLLRARPVEPAGLHDRRQRRRELGRRALPQVRVHRATTSPGCEVVLPDGELLELGGKAMDATTGPTCSASFVGSEGTLGIATEVTLRIVRQPEVVRTLLAAFRLDRRGGRCRVDDRRAPGSSRRRWRSWTGSRSRPRRRRATPATPTARRGAPRRARRCGGTGRGGRRRRRRDLPRARAPSRSARARDAESRTSSGRDGRGRSRRWAGSRPTTTCRTASSRGRSCRPSCVGSTSSRREHGLRVGNVFHAGDGNLHPLVLYDARIDGQVERAKALADEILDGVRRRGRLAHGRARHRRRQGVCDAVDVLRTRSRGLRARPPRLRPGRAREPRQGPPHAAPVRRGARPLQVAPARASGPGGAPLMRPATVEEASASCRGVGRGPSRPDRRRRLDCRARPRPGARGRRPDLHRRGGDPAVGAPREARGVGASGCPSTRPATRRSGHASPPASRARCPTATGRRAISCSA